jgi:hypothetical protein
VENPNLLREGVRARRKHDGGKDNYCRDQPNIKRITDFA